MNAETGRALTKTEQAILYAARQWEWTMRREASPSPAERARAEVALLDAVEADRQARAERGDIGFQDIT